MSEKWFADHGKAPTAIRCLERNEGAAIAHVYDSDVVALIAAAPETAAVAAKMAEALRDIRAMSGPNTAGRSRKVAREALAAYEETKPCFK